MRGALVAVVTHGTPPRDYASLVARAGATVRALEVATIALELAEDVDAVVVVVGDAPEVFGALAAASAGRPVLAVIDGSLPARRLTPLGPAAVFDREQSDEAFIAALEALVSDSQCGLFARLGDADERGRVLSQRLSAIERDAQTMLHDVRVLSGVAIGYAANMRDGFAGELSRAQAEHVAQVLAAANDMGALLERFGAALRRHADLEGAPTSRRALRRRTACDLHELVAAEVGLFENVARENRVSLSLEACAPVRIWCDATQIKQVLTNLIFNALKFTPAGGAVRVSVGLEALVEPEEGEGDGPQRRRNAELRVIDNGPGVAEDERERIFERGFRSARHRSVAGSGVGLSVVREVAILHGGRAYVEPAPSGGAAFVVTLPVDLRRRRDEEGRGPESVVGGRA